MKRNPIFRIILMMAMVSTSVSAQVPVTSVPPDVLNLQASFFQSGGFS